MVGGLDRLDQKMQWIPCWCPGGNPRPLFCVCCYQCCFCCFQFPFPRLFNLFIYESISNSFDYILFASQDSGVSIFAIKNGNTLRSPSAEWGRGNSSPQGAFFCNIKWGTLHYRLHTLQSDGGGGCWENGHFSLCADMSRLMEIICLDV